MDNSSIELVRRFRDGHEAAAGEIFDRYVRRLIALTRSRISSKLARRVDPEDVVQSAYRSFFVHAREGDFVFNRAGDLWRLLAAITLHKLHRQVERHTTLRRDVGQEKETDSDFLPSNQAAPEPTPEEAVAVVEQLGRVMQQTEPQTRRVLEMRLQGHSIEQIAVEIEQSQRTVRRLLEGVRRDLERQLLTVN